MLARKFSRGNAERYTVAFCAALINASAPASEIFQNLYNFEHYNFLIVINRHITVISDPHAIGDGGISEDPRIVEVFGDPVVHFMVRDCDDLHP